MSEIERWLKWAEKVLKAGDVSFHYALPDSGNFTFSVMVPRAVWEPQLRMQVEQARAKLEVLAA